MGKIQATRKYYYYIIIEIVLVFLLVPYLTWQLNDYFSCNKELLFWSSINVMTFLLIFYGCLILSCFNLFSYNMT